MDVEENWMRRAILGLGVVAVLAVSLSSVAVAQFSSAEYDPGKPATKHGFITKVDWKSPQGVLVYLDVKDPKTGKIENWICEMGPRHLARNAGWTEDTLEVGELIMVTGHLAKDGSLRIKFVKDLKVANLAG
jgi:Family of unknown function (DUF6152)